MTVLIKKIENKKSTQNVHKKTIHQL